MTRRCSGDGSVEINLGTITWYAFAGAICLLFVDVAVDRPLLAGVALVPAFATWWWGIRGGEGS